MGKRTIHRNGTVRISRNVDVFETLQGHRGNDLQQQRAESAVFLPLRHNEVTGGAPELQITGRRFAGDAAQDYIVSKQFALGTDRNSSVKIISGGKQIICDCSIGDVVSFGGQTLDVNSFGCTIRFNGTPTVTDAT